MTSAYFTIHPGKNHPLQNGCWLKSDFSFKSTGSTSSTFPIQPDLSQNQPAAISLNTGSPRTSIYLPKCDPIIISHFQPISVPLLQLTPKNFNKFLANYVSPFGPVFSNA
jgi:hypothetical protein